MFWELVGVDFWCFGRLCRLSLATWGPGQVQETNLEAFWDVLVPVWEGFGSRLGVILVLCYDLLEIFWDATFILK